MAEIIGSLFGIDPQQLMRQRQATDTANAYRYAQLDPLEQAKFSIYQGSAGLGRGIQGLLGGDAEMQKASKIQQLSSQFDLSTPQGAREFGRALQPFAPVEAMKAMTKADAMEQSGLGRQKTIAETDLADARTTAALREPTRTALSSLIAAGKYTPASIALYKKSENPADLVLVEKKAAKDGSSSSLGPLTVAQKSVDNKFGKEYTEYFSGGGINNLEKNVSELARAIKLIEDAPDGDTSGRLIGIADKTGQLTLVSQKAADIKDIIGGVAQSNLRQILGGQFAQKEGEALLQRQYDTGQTKDNNLNRLRSLYDQASSSIKDKKAAAQYYEQFGTLKGFKGTKATEDKPPVDKNKEALDWIKANPTDPRVPAIKKKLGIQ